MIFLSSDEGTEVFQCKKSSQSKKLVKERRKKKHREKELADNEPTTSDSHSKSNNGFHNKTNAYDVVKRATSYDEATSDMDDGNDDLTNKKRSKSSKISNSSIHTEIRTDDFVVRLLFINLFSKLKCKQNTNRIRK